jgi:minor histocompatibility antigen H13
MKQVWKYTEDGTIDKTDVVVDLDANGNRIKSLGKLKDGVLDTTKDDGNKESSKKDEKSAKETAVEKQSDDRKKSAKGHKVFYLSLETPPAPTS